MLTKKFSSPDMFFIEDEYAEKKHKFSTKKTIENGIGMQKKGGGGQGIFIYLCTRMTGTRYKENPPQEGVPDTFQCQRHQIQIYCKTKATCHSVKEGM